MLKYKSPTIEEILELTKEHSAVLGVEYNEEKIIRFYNSVMSSDLGFVFGDSEKYLVGVIVEHPFFEGRIATEMGFYSRDHKGRELVKQYEEWAKELGANRTVLTTYLTNDVSNYYKRLGYTLLEQSYSKELI